ncbi:MAG TPA: hypothetical protein VMS21_14330 [Methylomirabilota bacterium]|nr:hypothetical protein [Methylomirabilota bacterium]
MEAEVGLVDDDDELDDEEYEDEESAGLFKRPDRIDNPPNAVSAPWVWNLRMSGWFIMPM